MNRLVCAILFIRQANTRPLRSAKSLGLHLRDTVFAERFGVGRASRGSRGRVSYFTTAFIVLSSACALAQHDNGRNAVRLLAEGNVDGAIALAAETAKDMNSPISEAEHAFVLSMAAAKTGDAEKAFSYAKDAVQKGMPVERFGAGPRDIFEPLWDHADFVQWIKAGSSSLIHGPMLGKVSDTSASFWVRTLKESDVQIEVTSGNKAFTGSGRTSASMDYTAVIDVSGLKPDTSYQYVVLVNGAQVGPTAEFKTHPESGNPAEFSVAFGGGAGFTPQYEHMWKTIDGYKADALLLLGDNVYIDDPTHPLTQRYCYYRRHSQPDWRNLVASIPVYTIYDDHDFGLNDCNPGPHMETPPWKRKVWEIYRENWNNPSYAGGDTQPGCWFDYYMGDVHFIMLDCRYYRDLDGGSMLGPVQKKWMLETLAASKGTFKVLVSSVPFAPGVKWNSRDTWDGFNEEREEIFSFIEKQSIEGVLLMSADRHRTDMRKIPRPNGYDLIEVMSSRLTNVHTHDLVKGAKGSEFVMGFSETPSFGLMEFNTKSANPQVTFKMIGIDGGNKGERTIRFSELSNR